VEEVGWGIGPEWLRGLRLQGARWHGNTVEIESDHIGWLADTGAEVRVWGAALRRQRQPIG